MLVSVCIATYARPLELKRLLTAINTLEFKMMESPIIEVIVVDNDPQKYADNICNEVIDNGFKWALSSCIEPQGGITYARNKSLSSIHPETDFVVFIDDDEVPCSNWLENLLLIQARTNADVVTGPVIPKYELGVTVPEWYLKGDFFAPPTLSDGDELDVAYTNNTLVSSQVVQSVKPWFDNDFILIGGSDTDYFMRVRKSGYRIVWASKAVVYDYFPESRMTIDWVLHRNYRCWWNHSYIVKKLHPTLKIQIIRLIKSIFLCILGMLLLPISLLGKKHRFVWSLIYIYRGIGSFSGLFNTWRYKEYMRS